MGKFIDPSRITELRSPDLIKTMLDYARNEVVRKIGDKERAGRKGDEEWHRYVKYYNVLNEVSDHFYSEVKEQKIEGPFGFTKKVDDIVYKRLRYGKDREMIKKEEEN